MASSTDLGQHLIGLGEDSIGDLAFDHLGGEVGWVLSTSFGKCLFLQQLRRSRDQLDLCRLGPEIAFGLIEQGIEVLVVHCIVLSAAPAV